MPTNSGRITRGRVFADESKDGDYLLVAAVVLPGDVAAVRQAVRRLALPGQARVHMKHEQPSRKREILSAFERLETAVTIYRADAARYRGEVERRHHCLDALIRDVVRDEHKHLVLERDESMVSRDRQQLVAATRAAADPFTYQHESAKAEPLLAIPDAVAWAWARGGDWRRRCSGLVVEVVDV